MVEVNEHLQQCEACAAAMTDDAELLRLMSSEHAEPDAGLLASCRMGLVDALDREEEGGWVRRTLGSFVPASWLAPRPAFGAAMLLVLGFSVGLFGPKMFEAACGSGDDASRAVERIERNGSGFDGNECTERGFERLVEHAAEQD